MDTGASQSIISYDLPGKLHFRRDPLHNDPPFLFSANGTRINIRGTMNLPIYIHGLIINHTVKVADNLFHSLLVGADFFT